MSFLVKLEVIDRSISSSQVFSFSNLPIQITKIVSIYSGSSIKRTPLVQKKCPLYRDVRFIEIFSKILWPQSKAIRSSSYCPSYGGVSFIVCPLYRDSTVMGTLPDRRLRNCYKFLKMTIRLFHFYYQTLYHHRHQLGFHQSPRCPAKYLSTPHFLLGDNFTFALH